MLARPIFRPISYAGIVGHELRAAVPLTCFLPGVILDLIFMATIVVCCLVRPALGGQSVRATWGEGSHAFAVTDAPMQPMP